MKHKLGKFGDFVPFVRGRRRPSRAEAMAAIPVRNDALRWFWEEEEVKVFIPRKKGPLGDILARMLRLPDEKPVVLDRVGSGIWDLCDGTHNVESLLMFVQRRHKLSRRETEVSVSAYLKILAERRLIAIKSPDTKGKSRACKRSKAQK